MAKLKIQKRKFEKVGELGLRTRGAYAGTVTEEGSLVSDSYVLFNRHFVQKKASSVAETLAEQSKNGRPRYGQKRAKDRLDRARSQAKHEGELLGHVPATPALLVRAENLACIRYRKRKKGKWHYVWVDAHRLRLMMELFKTPLRFFCASWDAPVVLKRGKRTVGCLAPASSYKVDIEVTR